jgi:hypothetical protein
MTVSTPTPFIPLCFNPPNIADYATFLAGNVGVPASYLAMIGNIVVGSDGSYVIDSSGDQVVSNPSSSQYEISLTIAINLVNCQLQVDFNIYVLCVYNLAADRLVNFGMDVRGQTFFKDLRTELNILSQSSGIVSSTFDNGSGMSYLNPDFMKNLTLMDIQSLKSPWGRAYIGYAQSVGSNWGAS